MSTTNTSTLSSQVKLTLSQTLQNSLKDHSTTTVQAWQDGLKQALAKAKIHNAEQIVSDVPSLYALPIYALIVVIRTEALANISDNNVQVNTQNDAQINAQTLLADWANAQANTPAGWQMSHVDDQTSQTDVNSTNASNASNFSNVLNQVVASLTGHDDRLTPVWVSRSVLCPSDTDMLTPNDSKSSAIAHVIDEQVTHHLQDKLVKLGLTDEQARAAFDCHILPVADMLHRHRLACFDMDSTLIEQEVIVELAKAAGVGDEVNAITESAMRGELEFDESFAERLALLRGLSDSHLSDIADTLTLSKGAKTTLALLSAMGYHTALLSGGFVYFAQRVAEQLGMNAVYANALEVQDGQVTGMVQLPIVNGAKKAALVRQLASELDISPQAVVCIGDGANDLPMMEVANLGLAYHAKPIVQARADAAINCTGLEGVLYALGYASLTS